MKRILRISAIVLLFVAISITFFACSNNSQSTNEEEESPTKTVVSVSIDKLSIPDNLYAGRPILTSIKMNVTYSDGTYEIVNLSDEYLTVQSKNKLSIPGQQNLEVIYEQCRASFSLYLLDPEDVTYSLTVTGGVITSVDNVPLNHRHVNGDHVQRYNKGTVVTIEWIEEEGERFSYWEANGVKIDTQPKTTVTMNNDYVYVSHSEEIIHTVRFITFNSGIPDFSLKRRTIASESEIASAMTMDRYVFVGWTEKELTQSEALSGTIKTNLVEFPYDVEKAATFYAVWAPIGFSYTNVSIVTAGGKTVDGKQIVAYSGSLTELDIPSSSEGSDVIAISKDAFSGENAKIITRITIPSTIVEIDEGAFRNCTALQAFYVDAGSQMFTSDNNVLYMNEKTILVAYPLGKVLDFYEIGNSTEEICDYAFYNASLGSLKMKSEVKRIGEHAFDSVHIDYIDFSELQPSKLTNIGDNVFSDYLQNICVDPMYETNYHAIFAEIEDKIIVDKTRLNSIYVDTLGNGTSILFRLITGKYFDIKTRSAEILGISRNIAAIDIPDKLTGKNNEYTVTSIAFYAFNDCILLENVTLPTKLERVCDHAFDDTPWASSLDNHSIIANNTLYKYLGNDSVYVLDNVKRIAETAFYENVQLEYVDITSNHALERIDAYAFYDCYNLKGFTAGSTESSFLIKTNLKVIDAYAFNNTSFLRIETQSMAKGENGVFERIGEGAFANNYYLETVDIDVDNLQEIDPSAFLYCYALRTLHVSDNTESYLTVNDILYKKTGINQYQLFLYPAAKISAVFNPSKPSSTVTLHVTSLGDYSLWFSLVGALEFEEEVSVNNANAINVPSLAYVRFLNENNLNNSFYGDVFQGKTGAKKFVFDSNLGLEAISGFFGNDNGLITQYATTEVPYTFYYIGSLLYSVGEDGLSIVGSDRSASCDVLTVPGNITVGGTPYTEKTISRYAFYGYNLESLTVEGVSMFEDNALSGAFSLVELTISAATPEKVPVIYENSLGERFNNDLLIYVDCDPTLENSYFDKWDGIIELFTYEDENGVEHQASKNLIYENAFIVLTYLDKNNVRHTSSVEAGTLSAEKLALVNGKNEGFSVGGWVDVNDNDEEVDIYGGYVIPYNLVLECVWVSDSYEITFAVPEGITLAFNAEYVSEYEEAGEIWHTYVIEIGFSSDYKFSVTRTTLESNKYNFSGWLLDTTEIAEQGVWSTLLSEKACVLKPNRPLRKYNVFYDTSDPEVGLGGNLNAELYYDEHYVLTVPTKNGYRFKGWEMADHTPLTNADGAGYSEWRITQDVTVYPIWTPLEINVTLKLSETDDYSTTKVVYASNDYVIGFEEGNIPEVLQNSYREKVAFFAGWADETGKIYTDAEGNALYVWDKYTSSTLYAVWPEFVSDETTLRTIIGEDDKASVVLLSDITLSEPIDCAYKGVFNGNRHRVYINQSYTTNGNLRTGIFTVNESGTIKNIDLYVSISVNVSGTYAGTAYIGGVCGKNGGFIEDIDIIVTNFDVEYGIVTGGLNVGCITGENNGIIRDVSATLLATADFTVLFESDPENKGVVCVGSAAGKNDGSIALNIQIDSYVVLCDGESYQGDLGTIGTVVGLNGSRNGIYNEKNGVLGGSCRYTSVTQDDFFSDVTHLVGSKQIGDYTNMKFSSVQ